MTLVFKDYTERRDKIRAVQFRELSQAEDVAHAVAPGCKFTLEVCGSEFTMHIGDALIERGDYIISSGNRASWHASVMRLKDFRERWEEKD